MSTDNLRRNLQRCVLIAVACLATSPAFAQRGAMTVPRNLDELTDRAQDIVRGTVVSAHVEKHPELTNLHTVVVTLRVRETLKGAARDTYTFRQYIWDLRDRYDAAGYRKGQELLLLMNAPSRYGLTSPVGIEQGRFRIQRDRSGRAVALNGARQRAAVRPPAGPAGQARRAHAAAGEPRRQASRRTDRARRARGHDPRLREERLMRRHSGALFVVLAGALAVRLATAGGPLIIDTSGEPMTWSTAAADRVPHGRRPLSIEVTNAEAQARVADMFDVWQDVASASIRYNRAGAIQDVGAFTDGDVSTAAEFNAVEGDCGNGDQSPIVYDEDGSLFEDLGEDPSVIGFAGPCAINGSGQIVSGIAVMNGIYQDGVDNVADNFELTEAEFDAAFVHEFGHFSGSRSFAGQRRVL